MDVPGIGHVALTVLPDTDDPHHRVYVTADMGALGKLNADALMMCGKYRLGNWHRGLMRVTIPELTEAVHDILNADS